MEQLTLKDIYDLCVDYMNKGIKIDDIQIYLGDDDELNGIHTGWGISPIVNKRGITEDNDYLLDMISENCGNVELKMKGLLIS